MRRPLALLVAVAALAGCGGGSDDPPGPLVATLGDSITAGALLWSPNEEFRALIGERATPRSQWQHWAERALERRYAFRNCGVEGERTEEIAARLGECSENAEAIVIQGGTNDLLQDVRPADAAANLRSAVQAAKERGLRTIVATVPPIDAPDGAFDDEVRRLNSLIERIAAEEEAGLIPFHDVLEDPRRPGRFAEGLTDDGVHPSIAGYRRVGRAGARVIARRLG